MPKKPAPDRLDLDAIGDLENYYDDELAELREKLIADIDRIEQENRLADARIKAFNMAKHALAQQRAQRSRAIRAVKHELSQRLRSDRAQEARGRAR